MKKLPIIIIISVVLILIFFPRLVEAATYLPKPQSPTSSCGQYSGATNTFSVVWSWPARQSTTHYWLQVYEKDTNKWYVNGWLGAYYSSYTTRNIPSDAQTTARYRYTDDFNLFSYWSDETSITCTRPTPTTVLTPTTVPTQTPTPTPVLAQPPAPTWSCTAYNPTRRTFRLIWYWRTQPQAYDYKFTATNTVNGATYYNDWTMKTRYPTSYVIPEASADTNIEATYLYTSDSNRTNLSPLSPRVTAFCASPTPTLTPTPTQNPSNLNLYIALRFNQATRIPTATIRNNANVPAIFQGESIYVRLFCKEKSPYSVLADCQEKRLSTLKDRLNTGEEIVINFDPLTNNQLESIDARVIAIDSNLDDIMISYSNLLNIFVPPTPIPTSTPTPTNTPSPTNRPIHRDLVADSLTFNTETMQSTLLVKLITQGDWRKDANIFKESSGLAMIKWLNNSGTVLRGDTLYYGQYARMQRVSNTIMHYYYEFDTPPAAATRYEVWIDDNVFIEPPENNRLLGTLTPSLTPTRIPTPTLTPTLTPTSLPTPSPTSTTVPTNTPMPNTTSPTPTPVDKKQSLIEKLNYPIAELGNCKDKDDCAKYCDIPANLNTCNEYAVKQGLRTREEAERIRNATNVKSGPGGCNSQENCAAYCDKPENLNVCLDYAEKNNLMSADELDKTKKVLNVISSGTKTPGDCKTPKQCQTYCSDDSRREECGNFALSAGLISTRGEGGLPGGSGPGGCKSKEECEAYCKDDAHEEECKRFAPGEGEGDRGSKGPKTGGKAVCATREECEVFCKNPANAEACKNVVIKGSEMSEPTIQGNVQDLLQNINQMPEESKSCLKNAVGAESFNKIMRGEVLTTPIDSNVLQSCFSQGVKEYEEKNQPTKKPDDFSTDYGSSGEPIKPSGAEQITTTQVQTTPAPTSEVKGSSTSRTLINIIFDWIRGK